MSAVTCKELAGNIRVGTCGFGLAQADYARSFSTVEVQHTFYQPPKLTTLERWRESMPAGFEFVIKAWQLITHDAKSPTYRRLTVKLSAAEREEAGYFRDSAIVRRAWETTLTAAKILSARTILFQCPASFTQTGNNIANFKKFIKFAREPKLNFGWEPRGNWDEAVVESICDELDLWHVVDPFINKTTTRKRIYFRLHGRSGWRYQYEDAELAELASTLPEDAAGYVFFNNSRMNEDALRFCRYLQ
jgi:uncharacterized protein YecE (DUF72 family)